MKQLQPYLIFTGNCREAMEFYRDCLNGEMTLMDTLADSPMDVPEEAAHLIFNSEMRAEGISIRASDNLPSNETIFGSNFSLFTQFSDKEEMSDAYDKLSVGGEVMMPLADTPSGGSFGMFADKYGIQWMLVFE
ncbi:MAG: VOC family protein [Chloroflexota bacterium]